MLKPVLEALETILHEAERAPRPSVSPSPYDGKGRVVQDGIVDESGEYLIRFVARGKGK